MKQTHSSVSNITQNSFKIDWSFEEIMDLREQSILITDNTTGMIKYQKDGIPIVGSQSITGLDADREYTIKFTYTSGLIGQEISTVKTLPLQQNTENVSASTSPPTSNTSNMGIYWALGTLFIFLFLFLFINPKEDS